jgi:hypothetical protein
MPKQTEKLVAVVCRIKERHPVHSEPVLLEVIGGDQIVDLRENNQFVIVYGNANVFQLTTKGYEENSK